MTRRSRIPERSPVTDVFDGAVLQVGQRFALALAAQDGADGARTGTLVLRYGVQYLGKPFLAIVPGLLALDYGDMLTGEAAFDFLLHRSNLHPRADVVGYRNDGVDDMTPVKWLDVVAPIHVLLYADTNATRPDARILALIAPEDADLTAVPPRLLTYLPRYVSLAAWLAAEDVP